MAFTVFQAGAQLYGLDQRGSVVALTLPNGVTLDYSLVPRFAVFGNYVIVVNSPTRPLIVDANLNVRVLAPDAPVSKATLSGVNAGGLTGTFKARQTYIDRDQFGNLISESGFGPDMDAVTVAAKLLRIASAPLSNDAISASRFYRTTNGTSVYFKWIDVDGNSQQTIEDDVSDAGLATLAAPSLGTPPDLSLVVEYKSRLFGVPKSAIDSLRYSEVGAMYAWPTDNIQPVARFGSDERGVTGFLRRRDALGIGRSNGIFQLVGNSDETFKIVGVTEDCGIESNESVAIYKNTAFFVWKDGIYSWDENGVKCLTDEKVRKWFTSDSTFNLASLPFSFAHIDPFRKKYRLFLASAGSKGIDCWIDYDIMTGKVWGPHTSHEFNPAGAFRFSTAGGLYVPMYGGQDGFCYVDRKRRVDGAATPIDFDVVTSRDDAGMPLQEKYFGELSVAMGAQPTGTLKVSSMAGDQDDPRPNIEPEDADMTASSARLGRVGVGKSMKVRFRNTEPDVDVELRGFEVTPVNVIGRRK